MIYTSLGGLFLLHQLLEVSGLHIIRWAVFIASAIGGE